MRTSFFLLALLAAQRWKACFRKSKLIVMNVVMEQIYLNTSGTVFLEIFSTVMRDTRASKPKKRKKYLAPIKI